VRVLLPERPSLPSAPAESQPPQRVMGRGSGTRQAETEIGRQEPPGGGAGGHSAAPGRTTQARGGDPQAERPLRGPGVPKARGREVEPAPARARRDRRAHHRATSPLRAASSRSLTDCQAATGSPDAGPARRHSTPLLPFLNSSTFSCDVARRASALAGEAVRYSPDSLGDALKRLDGLRHRLNRFLELLHAVEPLEQPGKRNPKNPQGLG
jgi:hypothetical protein